MAVQTTRVMTEVLGAGDTSNLRVTREYVEVFGSGQSQLHLTRAFIEVLSKLPPTGDAVQSINIISTGAYQGPRHCAQTHTLTISQTGNSSLKSLYAEDTLTPVSSATGRGALYETASHTMTFTNVATCWNLSQRPAQSLTFTQTAGVQNLGFAAYSTLVITQLLEQSGFHGYGASTVVFVQSASYVKAHPRNITIYASANNTLAFTQAPRPNLMRPAASQFLVVADILTYAGPKPVQAVDQLQPVTGYITSAYICQTFVVSAGSTILFTESPVFRENPIYLEAINTVSFAYTADNRAKYRSLSDTLSITQAAAFAKIYTAISQLQITDLAEQGILHLSTSHQIVLNQQARNKNLIAQARSTNLLLQFARSGSKSLHAEDAITLAHSLGAVVPVHLSALNPLIYTEMVWDEEGNVFIPTIRGLAQTVSVSTTTTKTASNRLGFTISAPMTHAKVTGTSLSAADTLALVQQLFKNVTASATNVLVITHQSEGILGGIIMVDPLTLTDTASFNIVRTLEALDQLDFIHVMGYVTAEDFQCEYHPWIGGGLVPNYGVPEQVLPPMPGGPYPTPDGEGKGVVFFYPFTGPTLYTWTTPRSPNFGNKTQFMAQRINRETRGGRKVIFADPQWPTEFKRLMTFSALKETEVQDWLNFAQNTLGQIVGYTDNNGRTFKGVIVNVQDPVTRNGKIDNSISIEFIVTARGLPLSALDRLIFATDADGDEDID